MVVGVENMLGLLEQDTHARMGGDGGVHKTTQEDGELFVCPDR